MLVIFASEFVYKIWHLKSRVEVTQKKSETSIPPSYFKSMVYGDKRNLVVLDNMVLDYTDYQYFHPGGKFTLNKNHGRDISKYFYGSNKLVNLKKEIR